nr:MAG TPA: peptidase [Caudoviricetes sp.]
MAKDKNEDIDLEFDLDDDFLKDLDDIDPDQEDPSTHKKDRKAIDVVKDAAKNTKQFVVDNQLIDNAIKSSLPKEFTNAKDELSSFLGSIKNSVNDNIADVNKDINNFKKSVAQVGKHYEKILPKSVKEWIDKVQNENKTTYRPEETEDDKINQALNEVFAPQIELQKQAGVRELYRDQIEKRRFETQQDLLYGIKYNTGVQANYTSEITSRYQRKNLELQHKQLYLQSNILKTLLETHQHQKNALDAIVKNTSLPDIAKSHKSEVIKEMGFRNLVDLSTKGFGYFISDYKDQVLKNANQFVKDAADGIKSGIGMGSMLLDTHQMELEMDEDFGEKKSVGNRIGGKAAKLLTSTVGKYLVNPKLKQNEKMSAIANLLENKVGNIAATLNRFKNQDSNNTFVSILQELLPNGNEQYKTHNFASESRLKDLAQFDIATRKSIVDIIPQLLSKIHLSTEGIRLGNKGELNEDNLLEWDHDTASLQTRGKIDQTLLKRVDSKLRLSGQLDDAIMIVNSIDNEFQLSSEARALFAKEIVARAGKWQGFDPTDYVNDSWKIKADESLIEEIQAFLRSKFLIDSFGQFGNEKMNKKALLDRNIQLALRKANEFQTRLDNKRGEAQNYLINMSTNNDTMLNRHVRIGKATINEGTYSLAGLDQFYGVDQFDKFNDQLSDKRQRELKQIYESTGKKVSREEFQSRKGYDPISDTVPNPLPKQFLDGKSRLSFEELNFMLANPKLAKLDKEYQSNKNRHVDNLMGKFSGYKDRAVDKIKDTESYQKVTDFVVDAAGQVKPKVQQVKEELKPVVEANVRKIHEKVKSGEFKYNLNKTIQWVPAFVSLNQDKNTAKLTEAVITCYSEIKGVDIDKVVSLMNKNSSKIVEEIKEAGIPISKEKAKEFVNFVTGKEAANDSINPTTANASGESQPSSTVERFINQTKSVDDIVKNINPTSTVSRVSDFVQEQMAKESDKPSKVTSESKSVWRKLVDRFEERENQVSFLDQCSDVYVKGETTPRLLKAKMEAGEYFNKANGEIITCIGDINNEVIDKQGNIILSAVDLKRGIETNLGEEISTQFKPAVAIVPQEVQKDIEAKVKSALTITMRTTDVYTKDNPTEPALTRWGMMLGRYINSKGKVIGSPKDIDGAVYDRQGNVIITEEQVAAGLVDKKGRPLRGYFIRRLRAVMDVHKAIYKPVFGLGKLALNTASKIPFLRKLTPSNLAKKAFTGESNNQGSYLGKVAKRMGHVVGGLGKIPYLNKVLPKGMVDDLTNKDPEEKKGLFSTIATAIGVAKMFSMNEAKEKSKRRKGMAEDILAEQDSAYEAKRKAREEELKERNKGKDKEGGILGFLKDAFPLVASAIGAVGSILTGIASIGSGIFSVLGSIASLFGLGSTVATIGKAIKTAAGAIPGAKAIGSLFGKGTSGKAVKSGGKLLSKGSKLFKKGGKLGLLAAGAYGISTFFNDANANESSAKTAENNPNLMAREVSSGSQYDVSSSGPDAWDVGFTGASVALAAPALKQTAKSLSGVAVKQAAKSGAKMIAGRAGLALLGPIGGAIMAAWTAYDVLSLIWDWASSPTKPDDFRIAAYGVLPENKEHAKKILAFEKWVLEKGKFDPKTGEFTYPKTEMMKEAVPQFMSGKEGVKDFMSQPKEVQAHYVKEFETWYEHRFKPTFESHVRAMNEVNPKVKLHEAFGRLWNGNLEDGLVLSWARRARITNVYDSPYNVTAYPFWVLEGSDEAEYRGIVVNKAMVDKYFDIVVDAYKDDEKKLRKLDEMQKNVATRRGEKYTSRFAFENKDHSPTAISNVNTPATTATLSVVNIALGLSQKPLGNIMAINGKDVFAFNNKNTTVLPKDNTIDDLTAIRMRLYGLINLVDTRVKVMLDMERALINNIKYDANNIASLGEFDYDDIISVYAPQLDWNIGNREEYDRFLAWFKTRFCAVYLTYISSIQKYKPNTEPLKVVDTLDPSIRYSIALDLANTTALLDDKSVSVWKLPTGPIRDVEPNNDPGSIARNLEALKNLRESKTMIEKDPKPANNQDIDLNSAKNKLTGSSNGITASSGGGLASIAGMTVNTSGNMRSAIENYGLSGPAVDGPINGVSGPAIDPNQKRLQGIGVNTYEATGDINGITWKDPGPSAWVKDDANKNFELIKDLFAQVGKVTGVDSGILTRMAKQESSFYPLAKARTSSATGLFQFLDGTWKEMIPALSKYGITNPDRLNPVHSAIAGAEYIKKNMKLIGGAVSKAGIPMDATAIYAAHFLGPGGAKKFFNQMASNPNDPMDKVGDWGSVIKANGPIFRMDKGQGRVKTPTEVYNTLTQKMNMAEANRFAETVQKIAGQTVTTAQGNVASGQSAATLESNSGSTSTGDSSTPASSVASTASTAASNVPDTPTTEQTQSTATTNLFSGETQDVSSTPDNSSTGGNANSSSSSSNTGSYNPSDFGGIPGLPMPGDKASVLGGYADDNNGTSLAKFPLEQMTVTSKWNPKRMHPKLHVIRPHRGIDLRANESTKVYATGDGRVSFAGEMNGYGKIIMIAHPDGKETRYAHLSKFLVKQGDMVKAGQPIGMAGNTGIGTGPHLHFEVRRTQGTGPNNATDIDPVEAMNASGTKSVDGKNQTLSSNDGAPQEEMAETKGPGIQENGKTFQTSSEILSKLQNGTAGQPKPAQGIEGKPDHILPNNGLIDVERGAALGNSANPVANGNEPVNYNSSMNSNNTGYTPPPSQNDARDTAYSQQQEKLFNKYSEQSEKMLGIMSDQLGVQREMKDTLKEIMTFISANGGLGSNYTDQKSSDKEPKNSVEPRPVTGSQRAVAIKSPVKMNVGNNGAKIY